MSLDKTLHKLQIQIQELAPTLELFVDQSIQPSVDDCARLQIQINNLEELIAIYKHLKLNKEISPSFNLHAKVSEKELIAKIEDESPQEVVEIKQPEEINMELKETIVESIKEEIPFVSKTISVGINDKFRFVNELFSQNTSEYAIALEQLNTVRSLHEAETYLNSLKNLYTWQENNEVVKLFYTLVKKRFS